VEPTWNVFGVCSALAIVENPSKSIFPPAWQLLYADAKPERFDLASPLKMNVPKIAGVKDRKN
jgi:hypothetical protein